MDPVVVRCALQRLARVDRPVHVLLSLLIEFGSLACLLNFYPLTLTILVRHLLLVVSKFRLVDKLVLSVLNRTQDTLVVL